MLEFATSICESFKSLAIVILNYIASESSTNNDPTAQEGLTSGGNAYLRSLSAIWIGISKSTWRLSLLTKTKMQS